MGGHGGLNILPQKKWNVYNYENREKVRRDEEEAAKEEQLKQEQSRRRDTEFRIERLRAMRGLPQNPNSGAPDPSNAPKSDGHINLFDGLEGFPFGDGEKKRTDEDGKSSQKKRKREDAAPRVVTAEDEKYRMGYGVAGKGVKEPWYLSRTVGGTADSGSEEATYLSGRRSNESVKKSGKKSIAELREERLKREKLEKRRTQNMLSRMNRNSDREDRKYSSFRSS